MGRRSSKKRPAEHLEGRARVDKRTKDLAKRIEPGDIAIIDHQDLDRVAADALLDRGVGAVINASPSISGRYPNGGPIRIVDAGVPLIDAVGSQLLEQVAEGDEIVIDGGRVLRGGEVLAQGTPLTSTSVLTSMEDARSTIGSELRQFAINTLEYVEHEAVLTFQPLTLPDLRTPIAGRHTLVVVRGIDYREDLRALRSYIVEYHPVLIAVDGGADALLEMRFTPDIIIGDFDSLSERAWSCGAELIHHVHPDGRGPGREELQAHGLPFQEFVVEGTSEDAAMLLAYEARATLIVAVGTHATMVEFLDKGRGGMSSTFLTRLRLGPALVDAKGVSRLYEGRVRRRDMLLLILSAMVAILAVASVAEPIQVFWHGISVSVSDLYRDWF